MDTMKDLIYNIESRKDTNYIRLSCKLYNKLPEELKPLFWNALDKYPSEGRLFHERHIPIRHHLINLGLWAYFKSKKQWTFGKCFQWVYQNLETLIGQYEASTISHSISKRNISYLAKQFEFQGFIPLEDFKDIKIRNRAAYITSNQTINGTYYIYPKILRMYARPGKVSNERFLWYQFSKGIPGYTRTWYPQEIKNLIKQQKYAKTRKA